MRAKGYQFVAIAGTERKYSETLREVKSCENRFAERFLLGIKIHAY